MTITFTLVLSSLWRRLISLCVHDVTRQMNQGCLVQVVRSPGIVRKLSSRRKQIRWPPLQCEIPATEVWVGGTRIVSWPPHATRNMSVPATPLQILPRCSPVSAQTLGVMGKHRVSKRNKHTPWGNTLCPTIVHKNLQPLHLILKIWLVNLWRMERKAPTV